jgi:protein-tyrosine phosphatase
LSRRGGALDARPSFVDCHSHAVPSGDDGAKTLAEGEALCADAAVHGTALLFATPHVWPHLLLTRTREQAIRDAHAALATRVELELQLGFELTPHPTLLEEDPGRYRLGRTEYVLVEVPFVGGIELLIALAEHIEAGGLRPLVAHPERADHVLERPHLAAELGERWTLQVNATSLLGYHGAEIEGLAWQLVRRGTAQVVASDGHRLARPARLDAVFERLVPDIGAERARRLVDGSAIGASVGRVASE